MRVRLLQGNEACVLGALAAGMRFFAGYPITPSTEIAEGCARELPKAGGHFIQMEDELASIAAVIGASTAGVMSMTATSGPGFSLMQENIGYAVMAEIPCVIVDVQRSGPSTGLATSPSQGDYMQARWGTHGDHPAISIAPSSVAEAYSEVIRAFQLSEEFKMPVIFLMDEIIGHMRESVELPEEMPYSIVPRRTASRRGPDKTCYEVAPGEWVPDLAPFGQGERYNMTGLFHDKSGFPSNSHELAGALMERLLGKVSCNTDKILKTEEVMMEDAEAAILCYGGTFRAAMEAVLSLREEGVRAGIIRPVTVWPFPEEALRRRAPQLRHLIVVEHNAGQMLLEAQRTLAGVMDPARISFVGRVDGTMIRPEDIAAAVRENGDREPSPVSSGKGGERA